MLIRLKLQSVELVLAQPAGSPNRNGLYGSTFMLGKIKTSLEKIKTLMKGHTYDIICMTIYKSLCSGFQW